MTEAAVGRGGADTVRAPSPARIPLWDNARFACIVLVVMGHAIQRQTADSNYALTLYLFIYAFHMPAFALISGYFSKAGPPGTRQMRAVITDILLPYLIMQSIWSLVQFLVEGRSSFNPTEPKWTLWFLVALALFRLVLPYLALLRAPLVWAVVGSIAVGFFPNVDSTFSLSRLIGILPFFVLGWQLRQWNIVDRWRRMRGAAWAIRGVALATLATWFIVILVNVQSFRDFDLRGWFLYDDSYRALGEPVWWAGLLRLALVVLAVVLCACFLVLVPRRATIFTPLGTATMYVYLLHSFVLYPIRESGVLADHRSSAEWVLMMVLASIAISIALSSRIVRRIFRPLIEPKPRWLFRELDDRPRGQSRTDPTGSRRPEPPR